MTDPVQIRREPGMKRSAPKIAWGDEYKGWSVRQRLRYAERLAESLNHALDVTQKDRDRLSEVCRRQEAQIEHAQQTYLRQGDVMHQQVTRDGEEKQELYRQIVDLQGELREVRRRLKRHEG